MALRRVNASETYSGLHNSFKRPPRGGGRCQNS
jgi:hypothetical protein